MEMHDLTESLTIIPKNLSSLIGLGMKFCPIEIYTTVNPTETLDRFRKDLYTKTFYAGRPQKREDVFIPKMHVESNWEPKEWDIPTPIVDRYNKFCSSIRSLFRKKRRKENNLLPFQKLVLQSLTLRTDILVVNYDKNLGPAIIETSVCTRRAFLEHLDTAAYRELTEEQATTHMVKVARAIKKWLRKHKKSISKQELRYLNHNFDPTLQNYPFFI